MKKWIVLCLPLCFFVSNIWAQGCSLCSINAKNMGHDAGIGLNKGIIYLAAVPLIIVTTLTIIWIRRNRPETNKKKG